MSKLLICCFSLVLMYPLGIDLYLVGLLKIAADLDAPISKLHLAFSIYLAGMASTMLLAGWLSDKFGRKNFVVLGSCIFAIASYSASTSQSIDVFLFSRFGQGIGAGFCYVMSFAIIRDSLAEAQRIKILSIINGITCIVPLLAPGIGSILLIWFDWQSLFISMMLLALITLGYCILFLEESLPNKVSNITETVNDVNSTNPEKIIAYPFMSRLVISSLAVTSILTYVNVSPMLLMEELHLSTIQYSILMGLLAGWSMISSFIAPNFITRYGQHSVIYTSQFFFILAWALFFFIESIPNPIVITILSLTCICTGFALGFGVVMSQALNPFKRKAGLASSILAVSQISCSAVYISIMSYFDFDSSDILATCLLITGVTSTILLALEKVFNRTKQGQSSNEKIISST
jgi:DHA1 family multidrug resistance protein-like MFS transporter